MDDRLGQASDDVLLDRRFQLGRVIAQGGMAVVREATHTYLKTQHAVKLMIPDRLGDPRGRERLLREGEYLVRVRHPNVVGILDAGDCPKRGPFLVMELVAGRPLDGYLTSRTRLSLDDLFPIVRGIAEALGAAHAKGIIHRDVKPANVMIVPLPSGSLRPVLVDFGVASHVAEDAPGNQEKLTKPGEVPGTIEYMAPEFIAGREADARVDLYALGVLAFECLTGLVPYPGGCLTFERSSREVSPIAMLERAGATPRIADVIARAIAIDPGVRQPSTIAFVDELSEARRLDVLDAERPSVAVDNRDVASRRAHVRAPYVAPLRVSTPNGGDVDGRTEDIAEGGVLLISQQPFVQGETVQVRLALPMSGRMETLTAVVRWAKPGRLRHATGLEFQTMSDRAREEIQQYVSISNRGDASAPRTTLDAPPKTTGSGATRITTNEVTG